jgi:phage protein D
MADGVSAAKIKIGGQEVSNEALAGAVVDQDIDQPDMCSITVNNTNEYKYSEKVKLGDAVEFKIADDPGPPLFVGEVAGLEPIFDVGGESKIIVRAFNKLHRLTRAQKSRTFMDKSDADIVRQIAGEYGLSPKINGSVNLKHKHVYQHDLTDLEFLHQRARRINYELLVKDKELTFRERDLSTDSGIKLKWGKDAENSEGGGELALQAFRPRLNSSNQIAEVSVRGWNSLKSEAIIGKATSVKTKLGAADGIAKSKAAFGDAKASYEMAVYSKEEADAAAKSLLEDSALRYVTGEGQCKGDPKIVAGIVVTIACEDKRFDGKYYVTGTTHRYTHKAGGPQGGYLTFIRFSRNAAEL